MGVSAWFSGGSNRSVANEAIPWEREKSPKSGGPKSGQFAQLWWTLPLQLFQKLLRYGSTERAFEIVEDQRCMERIMAGEFVSLSSEFGVKFTDDDQDNDSNIHVLQSLFRQMARSTSI